MNIKVDSHTHTLASAHAYSTISEMAQAAKEKGLELLAVTDHAPALEDSPPALHFMNYHVLPGTLCGVEMLYGTELSILDFNGNVDLDEDILKRQDICIASFHTMCTKPGTMEENTTAYINAMDNPYVNIIGHPDDGNVPVDFEKLVLAAKEKRVLIEINNSSLKTAYFRLHTRENILTILQLCKQYQTMVSLGTDAHFSLAVGDFQETRQILKEADFPESLVANTSAVKFKAALRRHFQL